MPRLRVVRTAILLAGALALARDPGVAAGDPCLGAGDRLAELAAAVDKALEAPADSKTLHRLQAARDWLNGRGAGLGEDLGILAKSARRLESLEPDPYDAGGFGVLLRAAFDGLAADLEEDRAALEPALAALPARRAASLRAKLQGWVQRGTDLAGAGVVGKGAALLERASRLVQKTLHPPAEIYGGPFRLVSASLDGLSEVHLNSPLVLRFSDRVDPFTVRPDTIQIRPGPDYSKQVAGAFEVDGPVVTFRPRLPLAADLSDSAFQIWTRYHVTLAGAPAPSTVRSRRGDSLSAAFNGEFTTASDPNFAWTTGVYLDAPPPRVLCTSPADALPAAPWTDAGGATDVPVTVPIALRFNRVPLHPAWIEAGEVSLWITEFRGAPLVRRIAGKAVLQQDFEDVRVVFLPSIRLPDRSRFVLQVSSRVTDLSGRFEVPAHAGRQALSTAAAQEALANPDGPLATLHRDHPMEFDPRTFLVFTTRDEAEQDLPLTLAFDGTDQDVDDGPGVDVLRTTASFNAAVPGAVAASLQAAGGDGRLGDLVPSANAVLDADALAVDGVLQYRSISIPAGVVVTVRGTRPAILRSMGDVLIAGSLLSPGSTGDPAELSYGSPGLQPQKGGAGGAGGGAGGNASTSATYGLPGDSGQDAPDGGGGGGGGGYETASTATYSFAGGGGGGGHAAAGSAGSGGTYGSNSSWNGQGGAAGAMAGAAPSSATTSGGRSFVGMGGGGGGAGGNNHYTPFGSRTSGAGGGGGGGGILVTTPGSIRVSGTVAARGGAGGATVAANSYYGGSPGGGGAGGSVALFAGKDLDVTGATLDVSGGAAGSLNGVLYLGRAGDGAGGFLRLEDSDGVIAGMASSTQAPAAATTGTYGPGSLASDPPSVFTGTWFTLGAFAPEVLSFTGADFVEHPVAGATIRWEIQTAVEDLNLPGRPDTGSLDPQTGASSDASRATGWVLLKDEEGIRDVAPALNGQGYRFFRIRVTFGLPDGLRPADAKPSVDSFRLRTRD